MDESSVTTSSGSASGSLSTANNTTNCEQGQLLHIPQPVTVQTNFGPIASQLTSPGMNDLGFLAMASPLSNGFPYSLASPTAMQLNTMNIINHNFDLPIIPPISAIPNNPQHFNLENMVNFNTFLDFDKPHFGMTGMAGMVPQIPPDLKIFEGNNEPIRTENTNKKTRGRKRKIKTEDTETFDDSFIVNDKKAKKRRVRGRKPRKGAIKTENDSLQRLLSDSHESRHEGFVGVKNIYGEVKIAIPPKIDASIEYEIFGHACTEKIEDILQPKKRTRYVRGLNDDDKKDRRREQNRNAAARSRARKNAMIAKVIQLHQENLALRAHVSATIRDIKLLTDEKNKLIR